MDDIIIRENARLKRGSPEYKMYEKMACDVYLLTDNATASYIMFRRIVDADEFEENKSMSSSAYQFFARDTNKYYLEVRRKELMVKYFEEYIKEHNLDADQFLPKKGKVYDINNISPEELRAKNLEELEDIKNNTDDDKLKVDIINRQNDLMNAKRRGEEEQNTDKYIHYYLPTPFCDGCKHKNFTKPEEDGHED